MVSCVSVVSNFVQLSATYAQESLQYCLMTMSTSHSENIFNQFNVTTQLLEPIFSNNELNDSEIGFVSYCLALKYYICHQRIDTAKQYIQRCILRFMTAVNGPIIDCQSHNIGTKPNLSENDLSAILRILSQISFDTNTNTNVDHIIGAYLLATAIFISGHNLSEANNYFYNAYLIATSTRKNAIVSPLLKTELQSLLSIWDNTQSHIPQNEIYSHLVWDNTSQSSDSASATPPPFTAIAQQTEIQSLRSEWNPIASTNVPFFAGNTTAIANGNNSEYNNIANRNNLTPFTPSFYTMPMQMPNNDSHINVANAQQSMVFNRSHIPNWTETADVATIPNFAPFNTPFANPQNITQTSHVNNGTLQPQTTIQPSDMQSFRNHTAPLNTDVSINFTNEQPSPVNNVTRLSVDQTTPEIVTPTKNSKFKCQFCKREYKHKSSLKTHLKIHSNQAFDCKTCGKKFTHLSRMEKHAKRHLGLKPFECNICHQRFTDKSSRDRHCRRHTSDNTYKCQYCNESFHDSSPLLAHVRRYHTNEKPFKCNKCPKAFVTSSELNNHSVVHQGSCL